MRKLFVALMLLFGGTGCAVAATYADGVALCIGCTTSAQFNAAAKQAAGINFTHPLTFLVVNPDSTVSKWIQVTPSGQSPMSIGLRKPSTFAPQGVAIPIDPDPLANVFFAGAERTSSFQQYFGGSSTIAWPVSTDEHSEIQGVIKYNSDSYIILLPGDLFPSYMTTRASDLMPYINQVLVKKNSGWAQQSLSAKIRGFLMKKTQSWLGKKGKVCTIWVHGASACFDPIVDNPSGESQISGSGKDADKNPLPDLWTPTPVQDSGSGLGVYTGDPGQRGYNLDSAATWGSGVWLVCAKDGDTLVWCYIQAE